MSSRRRGIILGAGLAGLSAAYHSGFPVYEASHRVGGTADSTRIDGFVFDNGIHVLHSRDTDVLGLLESLEIPFVARKRSAWIYAFGKYFSYPFQVNTSLLPVSVRMRCLYGFLARPRKFAPSNYEDWIVQSFGRGFASTFLIPYSEKFWRIPPHRMTFDWTGDCVPMPKVFDVLKGAFIDQQIEIGPNAVFRYPSEPGAGFAGIAMGLARRVREIHPGMKAVSIDPRARVVTFNHPGQRVPYDCLISSLPLPELVRLLPDVPGDVAGAIAGLECNSIAVVNLGVNRPDISDRHWVHFPEKEITFFRISFPANFCEGLTPPGTSSIQAEVSYDPDAPPSREDLLRGVEADLRRVGVLRPDDCVIVRDVSFHRYGYVIYNASRKGDVACIHRHLNGLGIFPCGRYGDWEYLWSDEAIASGKKAAERAATEECGFHHAASPS